MSDDIEKDRFLRLQCIYWGIEAYKAVGQNAWEPLDYTREYYEFLTGKDDDGGSPEAMPDGPEETKILRFERGAGANARKTA